jgi:hypothetical protein
MYKKKMKPAVVVGRETWAVAEMDMRRMGTWERKILRSMYGPEVEQGYGEQELIRNCERSIKM